MIFPRYCPPEFADVCTSCNRFSQWCQLRWSGVERFMVCRRCRKEARS